ncbi:hypothetical protein BJ170DRAFT_688592 [Xylariales sp. AK1849]|nr:hypothetical protein BJ170DRAFT_688592 [Xylariales sp. AK1849]
MFLVEKAYVIRNGTSPRLKSKLYIFNSFGMLTLFAILAIMNFGFENIYLKDGQCTFGIDRLAFIPSITFEIIANIYLTILFFDTIDPSELAWSFNSNLVALALLRQEPGWVCLLVCDYDILFSAIIVHWVTSSDSAAAVRNADQKNLQEANHREFIASSSHSDNSGGVVSTSRSVSTTRNYTPADEIDITTYPLLSMNSADRSAELLYGDRFGRGEEEEILIGVSTTNPVKAPELRHGELGLGVETVIIAGGEGVATPRDTENARRQDE